MAKDKPLKIVFAENRYRFYQMNFDIDIIEEGFRTPDTYDNSFKILPSSCGVYFILGTINTFGSKIIKQEIIYVGCSANLKKREHKHPILKKHRREYSYVQFFFKCDDNYKVTEIELIKKFKPRYNIRHNG